MAYKLKTIKVPTDNNMNFVMSVIFTDDLTFFTPELNFPVGELATRFEDIFGFPTSELYLNVISGYNVNTDPDALTRFNLISEHVSNYMYVEGVKFDMKGTTCRLHEGSINNELQYYDPVNDAWRSAIGGSPFHFCLGVNKYGVNGVNTARTALYLIYVPDLDDVTYEDWVTGGSKVSFVTVDINASNNAYISNPTQWYTPVDPLNLAMFEYLIGSRGVDPDDPYNRWDASWEGGGEGDYNNTSDDINTDLFNSSAGGSALASTSTIYVPDATQFAKFFDVLYGTDLSNRIASVVSNLATIGGKVTDYIVDVFILPFNVSAGGSYKFNMGFYDVLPDGQGGMWTAPIATNRFAVIDMGTVDITEYWGNALDYEADIQLYLPYIGYIKLDGRTVMGKTIGVKYNVDIMTGNCIAQISVNGSVLYQATGNCAYKLPSSQDNRANQILSMVGDAVKLAGVLSGV